MRIAPSAPRNEKRAKICYCVTSVTNKKMLNFDFFNRDAQCVARALLGKVIYHRREHVWLSAMIIETEAYYLIDKGSHASLGLTPKRQALFMPAGTIYMYYARGGDSLNISCQGEGNAVLIKSGIIYPDTDPDPRVLQIMQALNPLPDGRTRMPERLCSGQTLLCRSLGLKVPEWDQQNFQPEKFYIADVGYTPQKIIQTTRLGIPIGRDAHLPYRFIDARYARRSTAPSRHLLINS
jgi:DNA-3-methyladenine glycosylase